MLIWRRAQKPAQRVWQALGYASWLECTKAEFEQSQVHLTRQLTAAVIERELVPMGTNSDSIPESHLRPLGTFVDRPRGPGAGEKPFEINGEAIRAAWDEANARTDGKPTACHTCHTKKRTARP